MHRAVPLLVCLCVAAWGSGAVEGSSGTLTVLANLLASYQANYQQPLYTYEAAIALENLTASGMSVVVVLFRFPQGGLAGSSAQVVGALPGGSSASCVESFLVRTLCEFGANLF